MHEIPEYLALQGHDVHFWDYREFGESTNRLRDQGIEETGTQRINGRANGSVELQLHTISSRIQEPFGRLWSAVLMARKAKRWLKSLQPDVVISYAVATNGWQVVSACKKLKIPVIYRAIDLVSHLRSSSFRLPIRIAEKYVIKNSDLVVANNDALAAYIGDQRPRKRPYVFLPGISMPIRDAHDVNIFGRSEIVFMGTFFRFSGLAEFLRLFACSIGPIAECKVRLIGGGEDQAKLKKLVDSLDLQNKVIFSGFVEFKSLQDEMSNGAVAILPFQDLPVTNYALPGKVFQYIASGLPVVSTKLKGLQSVLDEGDGVTYAELGSEFVTRVEQLLINPDLRRAIVARGQRRISQLSDWSQVITEFESILNQVVLEKEH
jgi:glycosyltransferase involved in cell wall biosynthesis